MRRRPDRGRAAAPSGSQLALASRARPSLPAALSRPVDQLLEVGADDLAMDEEVRTLLERAGVRLRDAEVAGLLERTAGWPVGLYLAAVAVAGESPHVSAGAAGAGNGQAAAGQPPAGLLSRLSAPTVAFLTRTAVLDELSGPLCDAVLQVSGSDRVLESLAGSNLLLAEADHRDGWYRYHQLLRELFLAELERREPELVAELHRRAASWYEGEGLPELAIDHGQAAGDADRVARLVAALAFGAYAGGRVETARRWFQWFEDQRLVEQHPRIAVLGAQLEALLGNSSSAERWAAVAARGLGRGPADGDLDASMALLRTLLCHDGMAGMRADAAAAWAGLAPDSPWRPTALLMEGSPICSTARPTSPTRRWPGWSTSPRSMAPHPRPRRPSASGPSSPWSASSGTRQAAWPTGRSPPCGPGTWTTTPWPPSPMRWRPGQCCTGATPTGRVPTSPGPSTSVPCSPRPCPTARCRP